MTYFNAFMFVYVSQDWTGTGLGLNQDSSGLLYHMAHFVQNDQDSTRTPVESRESTGSPPEHVGECKVLVPCPPFHSLFSMSGQCTAITSKPDAYMHSNAGRRI
jgi:hypothetical protein